MTEQNARPLQELDYLCAKLRDAAGGVGRIAGKYDGCAEGPALARASKHLAAARREVEHAREAFAEAVATQRATKTCPRCGAEGERGWCSYVFDVENEKEECWCCDDCKWECGLDT